MAKTDSTLIGVQDIGLADVETDASYPAAGDWESVSGKSANDSVSLVIDLAEQTDIAIEESDFSYMTIPGNRNAEFKYSSRDFTVDNMVYAFGGSKISDDEWLAPTATVIRTKAVRIITKPGNDNKVVVIRMVKASLDAAMNGVMSKGDTGTLDFTIKPLIAQDANSNLVEPYKYELIEDPCKAPTEPDEDDSANTFGWTDVTGYDSSVTPGLYEYTTDGGSTWNDCTANPQTGLTGAIDAGNVQVRLKATAKYPSGPVLRSTAAYTT